MKPDYINPNPRPLSREELLTIIERTYQKMKEAEQPFNPFLVCGPCRKKKKKRA